MQLPIIQPPQSRHPDALKPTAVIFDLDGVLALCKPQSKFDWSKYAHCAGIMDNNPPNWPMISLLNLMFAQCKEEGRYMKVLICTGRPDTYQQVTRAWLTRFKCPFHELWMRAADDDRSDCNVKESMLDSIQEKYDIWFVVEDRVSVVEMWRRRGILCLQNVKGDY